METVNDASNPNPNPNPLLQEFVFPPFDSVTPDQIKEAVLNGVSLDDDKREEFNKIQQELERLSQKFSENVLDATKKFEKLITDKKDVEGLPSTALQLAAQTAVSKGHENATPENGPWIITLDAPSYMSVMQHARNRTLREEEVYRAYITRASSGDLDNTQLINQILKLKLEKAKLLGYNNFAEVSMSMKMATIDKAQEPLEKLRVASWDRALQEVSFAKEQGAVEADDLTLWDITFWSERLRKSKYDINEVSSLSLNTTVISEPTPKKTNRGRIKIPIEKILNKNKKHVTFSKRRKGLFKKASELCALCDVSVAIVTFSEAGKVYAFGHPTTDAVFHRYLHGGGSSSEHKHEYGSGGAIEDPFEDPRMPWWERPIEELGLQELESFGEALKQTMCNLERRITQLDYESQSECKAAVKFDFDYDFRLNQASMAPTICNQMNYCCNDQMNYCYNDYHHMDGVGVVDPTIGFLSPEFYSMASQYDQSDINSIVAMANFNRSNRGYGEF